MLHEERRHDQHATDPIRGIVSFIRRASSGLPGGWPLAAALRMSMSRGRPPTFCSSFLIFSSSITSYFGRARSAFSTAAKLRSGHSSISAAVDPCLRAASATDLSGFTTLNANSNRCFASNAARPQARRPLSATLQWPHGRRRPGGLIPNGSTIVRDGNEPRRTDREGCAGGGGERSDAPIL